MTALAGSIDTLSRLEAREISGTVASLRGLTLLVNDLPLPIGALVRIDATRRDGGSSAAAGTPLRGEVVGFDSGRSIIMLLGSSGGVAAGMRVVGEQSAQTVQLGSAMLGRIIDGFGRPIDGGPPISDTFARPLHPPPPPALSRGRIREPLVTGIRTLDGFLTVGRGQRVGIFSAAGVGKSTLLGSVARNTAAGVNVIALIGERGREVREFVEEALGPEGLKRSVVVVATSDEPPLLRVRAAFVACAAAEYFRDTGQHVLLMMDSITRFAQAQRQIGLATGEQPATRGFTPSVFAMLPVLLERAGAIEGGGSVTAFYAVLVEGDDLNEPVSDAVRGVLDGHFVLSRRLATQGHFPAIDVLASVSRLANDVCDKHHRAARQHLIRLMAAYSEMEELINIGAYSRGANPDCDTAIALRPRLLGFLRQATYERAEFPQTCRSMLELSGMAEQIAAKAASPPVSHAAAATETRRTIRR